MRRLEGRRCGGRPSAFFAVRYGMSEASELKKPATLPESSEMARTIAGVMTARMTEYSANV